MTACRLCCTSLTALLALTASARAQLTIQVPFVTVQTGPGGVYVRAPFVTVQVPRSVVVAPPQSPAPPPTPMPAPVDPAPVQRIGDPIPVPLPKPGQTDFSVPVPLPGQPAARPMTHREFAATFRPAPGTYDVVLLHPVTNQPVQVSFTLPPGEARVRTWPRQLNFDYGGRRDVSIRFLADGRVRVTN